MQPSSEGACHKCQLEVAKAVSLRRSDALLQGPEEGFNEGSEQPKAGLPQPRRQLLLYTQPQGHHVLKRLLHRLGQEHWCSVKGLRLEHPA